MSQYITYFEIAAFISSLVALPTIRKRKHLLLFPIILGIILSVEFQQTFFRPEDQDTNAHLYNIQLPLIQLLYMISFIWSMDHQKSRRILLALMGFFIALTLLTILMYWSQPKFNVVSYSVGSVFLSVAILMKFNEMLKSPTGFNFLKEPTFYIYFSFLTFTVGTLPYFTTINWLYYTAGMRELSLILINLMSILNYILYATYTICFLWMRVKKDYS